MTTDDLFVLPPPTPAEAAAILAALHRHRRHRAATDESNTNPPSTSRWSLTGRRAALRGAWAAHRASGWANHQR